MPNRLAGETSPYLQQHKDNPVDWYPWGAEALARAKEEDKPILLSIGYSACHWCHVMAHESFEDPDVASAMNRLFVNIKVDREERPDLDQVYQLAHQMLSQRPGGWPLTVFLTPGQVPFFAGTYFPKAPRYGMTGFTQLIANIALIYRERRADIGRQNQALLEAFGRIEPQGGGGGQRAAFAAAPIEDALASSKSNFDPVHGGFGGAPKFPHPAELQLCLRRYAATADKDALHIAVHTLERMALGGIYDQLGGGFSRYSVDAEWMIPHFEKMLYDNGPLLALLADVWTVTRSPLFERVAAQTAEWVMREMQGEGGEHSGGYYSSLDADSEHEEGKFYVWTREEIQALLWAAEFEAAAPYWGLDGPANFESTHWQLRVTRTPAALAQFLGQGEKHCEALVESARSKLYAARERRVRPGRDEKILTSWNALMIGGMARAGAVFGRSQWIESAHRAIEFIRATLWRDGRLLATYKDGRAHLNAYLDDHAFLLAAAIELVQADYRSHTLEFAQLLADALLEHFEDRDRGGFFFTSHDHESLIHRSKLGHDNATPSGNGVAAFALQRLSYLTGEARYAQAAQRTLEFFYPALCAQPVGHASLLMALEENLVPTRSVILRGKQPELGSWQRALAGRYLPATVVLAIAPEAQSVSPVLAKPVTDRMQAWVCEGATCLIPISDLDSLLATL